MNTGDWLYFLPKEITVREIYEIVKDSYEVEIWEAAGILEINIGEGSSVDVEAAAIHPKDTQTGEFAEKNGCPYVFLVTFKPEDYDRAKAVMEMMLQGAGGFFCGDTEDFTPVLR